MGWYQQYRADGFGKVDSFFAASTQGFGQAYIAARKQGCGSPMATLRGALIMPYYGFFPSGVPEAGGTVLRFPQRPVVSDEPLEKRVVNW